MARTRPRRRDLWAGLSPNGIGHTKPNHYAEMLRTVWENRDALPHALRILRKGVCDGCALGVAGLHDWTIDGVHLCTTRLNLLRVNTMPAMDHALLADVAALRGRGGRGLRDLGRLAYPMVRRRGEAGFRRVTWDDAMDLVAGRIREAGPDRYALYLTARGITNEVYYVAQKAVRAIGTNNVDNAARVCHAPSTTALKETIGVGATTVSYRDLMGTDLVVLWGADVANAQPVTMKYLYLARREGTRVMVVNPHREPGLERYWVPSNAESALLGTRMTDRFVPVRTGGDAAFAAAVLQTLEEMGAVDRAFLDAHTTGYDDLLDLIGRYRRDDLVEWSGASREDVRAFAHEYARAGSCVHVWSMGVTQHAHGADNVRAIVALALARGNIGRPGAGLMPIRGHSGVQGGAEMGAYATVLPGGVPITAENAARLSEQWGFPVPVGPGLTAEEMVEAAGRGDLEVLHSSGGNFLDVLPDPALVARRLEACPVRVHQDICVSSQMLVDPGEVVVLLPAATRYEQEGGGTETTTERRIAYSPEIRGGRPGEVRTEWRIFEDLARRVRPDLGDGPWFRDGQAVRDEIARVVPMYDGIQRLRATGDQVQWGGERLCEGGVFPTADGRARLRPFTPRDPRPPEGRFVLSTRRGKQFNSMVWRDRDPLTGAGRDALFISAADAARVGAADGDAVVVRSDVAEVPARLHVAPVREGTVQMFFPECNPLLRAGVRDPESGVPDYNATVEVLAAPGAP
jgi:molybdopterin-dependent oxidoreductase alpha subunit